MKEDQNSTQNNNNNYNQQIRRSNPTRIMSNLINYPLFYFLLLLFVFILGYMSAPTTTTIDTTTTTIDTTTTDLSPSLQFSDSVSTTTHSELSNNQLDNFRITTHCSDVRLPPHHVKQTILDRVFNSVSPYDNFPPPHVAGLLRNEKVKGWGSNGAVFRNLIEKVKPNVIIEVGTFLGASALHMNELTRKLGLDTVILCIDDFRGWPGFQDQFKYVNVVNGDVLLMYQFMQNVVYNNASGPVIPIPFSTGSALEKLCEWGVFGDLIEIDAGHDFNSAWADINRAYRLLRPGGVMFGHDYFTAADNRGVRRAVNLFAEINRLKIHVDGQHWVIDSSL